MMRRLFSAVWAALAFFCAHGAEISEAQALQAVRGWIGLKQMLQDEFSAEPESVKRYEGKDGKGAFYVVSLKGGGVVVTSGDTALSPVVAYSADGVWVDDPAKNPALAMLPIDIAAATEAAKAGAGRAGAGAAASGKAAQWEALLAAGASGGRAGAGAATSSAPKDLRVAKLLQTEWGQDTDARGNRTWNLYTPLNRVCGCVATATGQIMAYHKWPKGNVTAGYEYEYADGVEDIGGYHVDKGYQATAAQKEAGEYTAWAVPFGGVYDWDVMFETTTSWFTTIPTTAARQQMGRLVRDIGVASYMSYGDDGSGTWWQHAHNALLETFQYANAVVQFSGSSMSETIWKPTILSNLDAKLPVGVGVPGHAIVADGYGYDGSGNLYVHFNMGWEGSSDYWYNPPDLTASGQSGFTSIEDLLYNIYPENPNGSGTANLTIVSGRLLDGAGSALAGQTVTAKRGSETYTQTTDSKGIFAFKLPGGNNYVYTISASKDGVVSSASVSVKACASAKYVAHSHNGSYYPASLGTASNIHGFDLTVNTLPAPAISPESGTMFKEGTSLQVSFSCATSGVTFRYTVDGSEPTEESASGTFVTLTATATVKVKAFKSGYAASETASATYAAVPAAPQPSATPSGSGAATFGPRRLVTLECPAPGATIRYTTDGSEPTSESTLYTGPFLVAVPCTVKAKAWADGYWTDGSDTTVAVLERTPYTGHRWIDESAETHEATGTWAEYAEYIDGRMPVSGSNIYTPARPGGRISTIESEMRFGGYASGEGEDLSLVKAALRLGPDYDFEVLTLDADGARKWVPVFASGVAPSLTASYRVRFVLDCRRGTYTVSIRPSDGESASGFVMLSANDGSRFFSFASGAPGVVTDVRYIGEGSVTSIYGDLRTGVIFHVK